MFHQSPLAGCHMSLKGTISIQCISNSWAQNFNNHCCGRVLHFYSRLHSLFVCKAVTCKIICAIESYSLNDTTWINPQHVCILPGQHFNVWSYVSGITGDSREENTKNFMGPAKLNLPDNKSCIFMMSRMKCHEIWPYGPRLRYS